nr:MogA/MoaB family molybdenum cofactor biosynthesis protein [Candidatus Sigynarchaeota archaeon]
MDTIKLPDTVKEHKDHSASNVLFTIIIVSTTRYNEIQSGLESTDRTVDVIKSCIGTASHSIKGFTFIPDDEKMIANEIAKTVLMQDVDVIVTSGGTGISPKDQTVDVIRSMASKELAGFGELFRHLSYEDVGTAAFLSRAEAFIFNKKPVFCLPGSPKAVRLALERLILPEIGHVISQLRKVE